MTALPERDIAWAEFVTLAALQISAGCAFGLATDREALLPVVDRLMEFVGESATPLFLGMIWAAILQVVARFGGELPRVRAQILGLTVLWDLLSIVAMRLHAI